MTCVGRKGPPTFSSINLPSGLILSASRSRLPPVGREGGAFRDGGGKLKERIRMRPRADESNHFICTRHSRPRANLESHGFKAGSSSIYETSFPYSPPLKRVHGTCHAILSPREREQMDQTTTVGWPRLDFDFHGFFFLRRGGGGGRGLNFEYWIIGRIYGRI